MRVEFHKHKSKGHPWGIPPVLDMPDEPLIGDTFRVAKNGKQWKAVSVYWCFLSGNRFSHFSVTVV